MRDRVIEIAEHAHALHWRMSGDEGTGDRLAKMVTDVWQAGVVAAQPGRFAVEYRVSPQLREQIDVVDLEDGVAYELKVSPNNAHFEFYKDIFKAIVARDTRLPSLRKFVFLVPESAARVLMRNLAGLSSPTHASWALRLKSSGSGVLLPNESLQLTKARSIPHRRHRSRSRLRS